MKFVKQNFSVILAFSLPILAIVGFWLYVYIPSLFISTDYNFIYEVSSQSPKDSKIELVRFYLHDTKTNQNRELGPIEVNNYKIIDSDTTSPDGVTFTGKYTYNGMFFGGSRGSDYTYFLQKNDSKRHIDLTGSEDASYPYYSKINFRGWVSK